MKKTSALLLSSAMMVSLLAGCGGQPAEEQTNKGAANAGQVNLKLYTWLSEDTAHWSKILPEFYKEYPNIKVDVNILATKDDAHEAMKKLDLAAASGQEMDVVMLNNSTGYSQRVNAGMLAPLDDYLKADGVTYDSEYKATTQINGKYYALPGRLLTWFVLLNKQKLDEAGLPVPKEWTWDEFMDYSKKLTKGEGPSKLYGTYFHAPNWMQYITLANVNNPENNQIVSSDGKVNINTDRIRKSLQIANQVENVDKSAHSYADVISQKLTYRNEYFGGKAAMIPTGNWMITETAGTAAIPAKFVTAFAPYPKYSKDDPNGQTLATIDYVGVAASSKHPKEAYQFTRWFSTKGILAAENMISSWNKADLNKMIDGLLKTGTNPEMVDRTSLEYVMNSAKAVKIVAPPAYIVDAESRYTSEVEKYLLGKQDLETTITNAEKAVTDVVKTNK
ncbi:extracellular solute-binding protein [Paenibacillus filicis]|uniref:Extracellular solute-binding protein n=1 Tax=Paenibacillus gyeongsangnamensis TaxID=3388067 RepID=A0ABT4QF16_9BACL|nr:extracellular solute-binding protein [Paenibacillus filicis]MCZ8515472.1 extracellular solute-binding protein [Paenibacillus filicis]